MKDERIDRLKTLLKNLKRNEAVSLLNSSANEEKDPKTLLYIVKELGKYKDRSSVNVLIELLNGFKDNREDYQDVRQTAANILGNFKDETAILPLMYIMNDKDESYRVRLWAADALGKIGSSQAVPPLLKIMDDEDEKSVYLKESAAKALGRIDDERAVESLAKIVEDRNNVIDKFIFLKEKAIEALGKLTHKKERRVEALKNVLKDDSPHVRASAIEALSDIDDPDVTDMIEPMLYDSNESVAKTTVCALYNREGKEYIVRLLRRDDLPPACKDEIMQILEEIDKGELEEDDDEE